MPNGLHVAPVIPAGQRGGNPSSRHGPTNAEVVQRLDVSSEHGGLASVERLSKDFARRARNAL